MQVVDNEKKQRQIKGRLFGIDSVYIIERFINI